MALRFYSELESSEGNIWKVEIHDSDFVDTAAAFTLASPGFTLSYFGGQDLFAPLMPSTCTVHMMVQNAAELQLVTDLADFQEGRFLVRVIADPDVAADVHWVGMMTAESIAVVDEYFPQAIDMRAICGLATLSTVPFDEDAGALTGSTTLGRVYQSLAQIPTGSLYDAADIFFAIGTDVQPNTGDEFIDLVRMQDATYNILEEGETIRDSEEMLAQICTLLNSRIAMIGGRWMIAPMSKMMDIGATLTNVRKYVIAGTLSSTSSETVAYTISQSSANYRLAGWQQQYLPAVRKITRQLDYLGNAPFAGNWRVNPSSFSPIGSTSPTDVTHTATAAVTLPTTQKITIVGAVELAQGYVSGLTGDNQLVRYRVEMTVKVGSLYLNRQTPFLYDSTEVEAAELGGTSGEIFNAGTPGPFTWSTNSANRVTYFSDILTVGNAEAQEVSASLDWAFTTPETGTTQSADVVVTIEVRGYNGEATIGNPDAFIAPTSVRDACIVFGDVQLFLGESIDTGDTLSYSASIANGATEELELESSRYGEVTTDALYLYNPGALLITGGNPTGFTSTGTTSASPINELICMDRLRHMAKQQEIYAGGAIGGGLLTPLNRIGIGSNFYLVSQLTMSAETDSYDLELTLVKSLDTSTPTGGSVVRSSKLPTHTTAGSSVSILEGQRRVSAQNTAAIALEGARTDALVIDDLGDVDTTTRAPADGDVLEWVAASSEWQPLAPSGGGGSPFPSDHLLWEGSGTSGFPYFTLSNTSGWISWSTLKNYISVNYDSGSNGNASKQYVVPATGYYEMNFFCMIQNQSGSTELFSLIAGIRSGSTPNSTVKQILRTPIEIPNGYVQGLGGTGVFYATSGTIITPGAYILTDGSATYRFYYASSALHGAIRRIA